MKVLHLVLAFALILSLPLEGCSQTNKNTAVMDSADGNKTEKDWKEALSSDQYKVLREKGTEAPFSGKYYYFDDAGLYRCTACNNPLFASDTKFDSGTGWPSFYKPYSDSSVVEKKDYSHGMVRTEIACAKCGGHLGHVFDDGPAPTGLRYCINSVCLDFVDKDKIKDAEKNISIQEKKE